MPDCINLREAYGNRFRVIREEGSVSWHDPWYHMIRCKTGTISPFSETELVFCSKRRGNIPGMVCSVPGTRIHQDGDDGVNIVFPISIAEQIFPIVKPYVRRHLSPELRQEMAERLQRFRESSAQ